MQLTKRDMNIITFIPSEAKRAFAGLAWVCLYLMIALWGLKGYIEWSSVNFLIGLCSMPLMLGQVTSHRPSYRFFWLALLMAFSGLLMPVKTALYLSLCCAFIFTYENISGKVTLLPLFALFLMFPVFQYFAHIFSFPIRLWLTGVAGQLIWIAGIDAVSKGNIISCHNSDFSVDPACMGLNMLTTSLLCGLIMVAVYQKRTNVKLTLPWLLLATFVILVLNIIANLMRILILVYFKLLPDHILHGFSGIICLVVYVLLPGSFILRFLVRKKGNNIILNNDKSKTIKPNLTRFHLFLLLILGLTSSRLYLRNENAVAAALPTVPGYQTSWFDRDVLKIENANALIYIKPLKGFVYTDHNPLICWTGSGYTFENVEEQQWQKLTLFTGTLLNGKDKLYTAWWYDNGSTGTTSQWIWRWQMFKGDAGFCIVNITTDNPASLQEQVMRFQSMKSAIIKPQDF